MKLDNEAQQRLNKYLDADIETLSLGQLADFALILDIHREEVAKRLEPDKAEPKRVYPRFV